jgi:acetyl-CoA carboxylase biotin carboxyl carrier protein
MQPPTVQLEESIAVSTEVCAEMVANVLSVSVVTGDIVADGDMLLLLESMKMEIPVPAEGGGTVLEVRVTPGDVVQEGDVLVVLG